MSIAFSDYSIGGNVNFAPLGGAPMVLNFGDTYMRLYAPPLAGGGVAPGTRTSSAAAIAYGMGWAAAAAIVPRVGFGNNFVVNAGPVLALAELDTSLLNLSRRWWMNDSETERRTVVNNFLRVFINRAENAPLGIYLERELAFVGQRGRIGPLPPQSMRVGHGKIDFLIGPPIGAPPQPPQALIPGGVTGRAALALNTAVLAPPAPIWNQALIMEAKLNLAGGNLANAQWQLCATLATLRQMAPPPPVPGAPAPIPYYYRGILTDGRHWAFYQYNSTLQVFHCTPMIDVSGAPPAVGFAPGGAMNNSELVLRMLRKFVLLSNQPYIDGWI